MNNLNRDDFQVLASNLTSADLRSLIVVSRTICALMKNEYLRRLADQKLQWEWLFPDLTNDFNTNERMLETYGASTVMFARSKEKHLYKLAVKLLDRAYQLSEADKDLLGHAYDEHAHFAALCPVYAQVLDLKKRKFGRPAISPNDEDDDSKDQEDDDDDDDDVGENNEGEHITENSLTPHDLVLFIKYKMYGENLIDACGQDGIPRLPDNILQAAMLESQLEPFLLLLCKCMAQVDKNTNERIDFTCVLKVPEYHYNLVDLSLRRFLDEPASLIRNICTETSIRDSIFGNSTSEHETKTVTHLSERQKDASRDLLLTLIFIRMTEHDFLFHQPYHSQWNRLMEHPVVIKMLTSVRYDFESPLPDNYEGDVDLFGLEHFLMQDKLETVSWQASGEVHCSSMNTKYKSKKYKLSCKLLEEHFGRPPARCML